MLFIKKMDRWRQKIIWFYLFFAVIVSIFFIPAGHDMIFHIYRIGSIADNLKWHGILGFPYRIYVTSYHGFGYGAPLFYGDFFLYIPAIFVCMGMSEWMAYRLFMGGIFLAAFAAMYYSVRMLNIWKCQKEENHRFAILSALLYIYLPGFIENMWIRAAIGEAIASIFLPIVFCMIYKITLQENWKRKHVLLLGIGIAGLILSHVLMTIMVAVSAIIFLLFHYKKLLCNPIRITGLFFGIILAVCLTAYWIFPFIEQYIIIKPGTNSTKDTYVNNRIRWCCWLIPFDIYKAIQNYFGNPVSVKWLPSCFGWIPIMLFYTIYKYYRKIKEKRILWISMGAFIMLVLITLKSWNELIADKLLAYKLQFPWRILMLVYFLLALSIAYIIICVNKEKVLKVFLNVIVICSLIPAMLIIGYGISNIILKNNILHKYQIYSENGGDTLYLPKGADLKEIYTREGSVTSDQDITFYTSRTTGYIRISIIENRGFETILNVPFLYYKGYYAKNMDTGKVYPIEKNKQGYLNVIIGHDIGNIIVYYKGTIIQKVSNYISLLSCIGFFLYFVREKILSKGRNSEIKIT